MNPVNNATDEGGNNLPLTTGVTGGLPVGNGDLSGSVSNQMGKCDQWEFPRHRLKFFNILGEGAFGQVWRCEATDIDGELKN